MDNKQQITPSVSLSAQQREQAIKYVFTCLQATYGNYFINNFKSGVNDSSGADIGLKTAQKFWLQKLDFFFNSKEGQDAVKEALNNLPIYPPNLIQFFESVKNYWCRYDQLREQAQRMKELHTVAKITSEQQKENVKTIMNNLKNMFANKENVFN